MALLKRTDIGHLLLRLDRTEITSDDLGFGILLGWELGQQCPTNI